MIFSVYDDNDTLISLEIQNISAHKDERFDMLSEYADYFKVFI